MNLSYKQLLEIESQLNCPSGEGGLQIGATMNDSNAQMISSSIELLNVQEDSCVLEVGHGIGGHVKNIIRKANTVQYIGLEISKTMNSEAIRINKSNQKQASFIMYDGVNIPFGVNTFDRILTVNTIYFWSNPRLFLKEIYRVLKPGSKLVIAFADKKFMLGLPFVNHRFKLYSKEILTDLYVDSQFISIEFTEKHDSVLSKSGELVNRIYLVAELFK